MLRQIDLTSDESRLNRDTYEREHHVEEVWADPTPRIDCGDAPYIGRRDSEGPCEARHLGSTSEEDVTR